MNPLHTACRINSLNGVKKFLAYKAFDIDEPTGDDDGWTPLMISCVLNHLQIVVLLVQAGASLDARGKEGEGYTALMYATMLQRVEVVEYLLREGASLEIKDDKGHTALIHAASKGYCEVMKALLKKGAIVESCQVGETTALHCASHGGEVGAVAILVSAGAKLDFPDINGRVPLELASKKGHYDVVKWMLSHTGIALCGGQSEGRDALRLASSEGHVEVMQLLMEFNVCSMLDLCTAFRGAMDHFQDNSVKFLLKFEIPILLENTTFALKTAVQGYKHGCASSRLTRLLMDAGARTTEPISYKVDGICKRQTVLEIVAKLREEETEEKHVQRLDAIHRLLRQEDAVHSSSLLWPLIRSPTTTPASSDTAIPAVVVRLVRRSKGVRGRVVKGALFRYVQKTADTEM